MRQLCCSTPNRNQDNVTSSMTNQTFAVSIHVLHPYERRVREGSSSSTAPAAPGIPCTKTNSVCQEIFSSEKKCPPHKRISSVAMHVKPRVTRTATPTSTPCNAAKLCIAVRNNNLQSQPELVLGMALQPHTARARHKMCAVKHAEWNFDTLWCHGP